MRTTDILSAWEEGLGMDPVRRALLLLRATRPDVPMDDWVSTPIGERDRSLMNVREHLFGRELQTVSQCPACSERMESSFLTSDINGQTSDDIRTLAAEGYEIQFRLPTSADLLKLLETTGAECDTLLLLHSCVSGVDVNTLPDTVVDRIAEEMERCDPAACVRIQLSCPSCGHSWESLFDIAAHLWGDVDDWAHRLLDDVHRLARAYGWSEESILAMSATRRHLYLQRVAA